MVADLSSSTLESVANAVDAFEEEKGLILCHLRPSTFSKLVPLFSVPQGYYALVQRGGKFADYGEDGSSVWPPGLHFGVLKHVTYLVTKQSVVYHCNVKHCITRDNIPILVRVTLMLRVMGDAEKDEDPSLVRTFVHEVGVRGLESQLVNAVAEAIRVMARATTHKAVYALISGADASRDRPRSPSTPSTANTLASAADEHSEQNGGAAVTLERTRHGSIMKRVKVAPDPCSDVESLAGSGMATASTTPAAAAAATAAEGTTAATVSSGMATAAKRVQEEPLPPPTPSPLPAIQRGLRASRIFPLPDAAAAATSSDGPTPGQDEEGPASPFSFTLDDHRRVHPSEAMPSADSGDGGQDPLEGLCSGGGGGGGGGPRKVEDGGRVNGRIPSRPPPAATNLDLTSRSQSALSSASTLPPLELDVAPLPCLSPALCSPANGETTPGGAEDGKTDGKDAGAAVDAASEQHSQRGGGAEGRRASSTAGGTAAQATKKEELDNSNNNNNNNNNNDGAFLGSRHVEEVRDSLNRTFVPQGVEITAVMIRSVEIPSHIATQMSRRTMNASIAEEQRAVKRSESQRVRHEGEVLGLKQRCEIERALALREGDREVAKAKDRLRGLRARAEATMRAIAAESASAVQRHASEAQREVSRTRLEEMSVTASRECVSSRVAGVAEAEAVAFRTRKESEAQLEVTHNIARARSLVDKAEGDGAPMLRAARNHCMHDKRLQA
ncbi:unnamed protein product, partial [Ectocarpus fasciculatus]